MITTAKKGQNPVVGNDFADMLVCPDCGQVIATLDTQGTTPNQTIAWVCIAGHSGTMTEQT